MKRKSDLVIRLLTLNCFSLPFDRTTRSRLLGIAEAVRKLDVDVVFFQEVHLWRYANLLIRHLSNLPYRACADYLYTPKGGLLILSRFPIQRQRFVLYEKRGLLHTPGFADWLLHKGILLAEMNIEGTVLVLANTHLLANYDADWSLSNQYAMHEQLELEQLKECVRGIDRNKLLLLGGDFNIPTDTALYQDFLRSSGLHDPLAERTDPTFRPPRFLPEYYARALDHVLVRAPEGRAASVSTDIVLSEPVSLRDGSRRHLSDHSALRAEVKVE